jgi:hypothetical protein
MLRAACGVSMLLWLQQLLFLSLVLNWRGVVCLPHDVASVTATDKQGVDLGTNYTAWTASTLVNSYWHPRAYEYSVGNGPEVIRLWQPFDSGAGGGVIAGTTRCIPI